MDSRVIELTSAAHKHGNLNIRSCGKSFFPKGIFGGSSKKDGLGVQITLEVDGLPAPVKTDIPTDKNSGRPRWIFRERSWVKQFVLLYNLDPGNTVIITRVDERTYNIRPNNNRVSLVENGNRCKNSKLGVSMLEQLDLFEKPYTDIHKKNDFKVYFPLIKDVTFAGGMNESAHRWFRLTPSYSPELVRLLFRYLQCNENTIVLDPFLGKGTTIIECKKFSYPGIGIEINPLLVEISKIALQWNLNLGKLKNIQSIFIKKIEREINKNEHLTCEEYCERNKVKLPIIHNAFRWWKNDILRNLLLIRSILRTDVPNELRGPFWIALCVTALDCANVHRNHPTISFDDNHNRNIDVIGDLREKLRTIFQDLKELSRGHYSSRVKVFLGDSVKDLNRTVKGRVDRVITSPPYPNRFSYIHTTRPQLYFMEILTDVQSATEIDMHAVGGTWGRATSILMREEVKPYKAIEDILDFRSELLKQSLLMCNYATKYFNDMFLHMTALKRVARKNFRGAYVVGNSRLKKVEIHTELYLAKMFERLKFQVDEVMFFRKRGGKKKLYESAVCIRA